VKRPADATPRPLTPEGAFVGSFAGSPDGAWVAVHENARIRYHPVAGGEPRDVPGYEGQDLLLGWSSDGRFLYLRRDPDALAAPAQLFRLDLQTGEQTPWMELLPPERIGMCSCIKSVSRSTDRRMCTVTPGTSTTSTSWTA
jgi:Tol biopolymer transport system component